MKSIYEIASELRTKNVKVIFNEIDGNYEMNGFCYSALASAIMEMVIESADGFVKDICERFNAIDNKRVMSDKQRWCVAFAFQKVSDEVVEKVIARAKQVA